MKIMLPESSLLRSRLKQELTLQMPHELKLLHLKVSHFCLSMKSMPLGNNWEISFSHKNKQQDQTAIVVLGRFKCIQPYNHESFIPFLCPI